MLGVNMPAGRTANPGTSGAISPVLVGAGPAATLGLKTFDLGVAPILTPNAQTLTNLHGGSGISAAWFSGPDGVVAKPGEPALPLALVNVTPNDAHLVLRGIGYRSGTYVDAGPMFPFTGAATTESRGVHVSFLSPVDYPSTMWTPNRLKKPLRGVVVVALAVAGRSLTPGTAVIGSPPARGTG